MVWFEFDGKQNFGQFDLKKVQQSCRKYWSPPLQLVDQRGGGGSQNFPFEKKSTDSKGTKLSMHEAALSTSPACISSAKQTKFL